MFKEFSVLNGLINKIFQSNNGSLLTNKKITGMNPVPVSGPIVLCNTFTSVITIHEYVNDKRKKKKRNLIEKLGDRCHWFLYI